MPSAGIYLQPFRRVREQQERSDWQLEFCRGLCGSRRGCAARNAAGTCRSNPVRRRRPQALARPACANRGYDRGRRQGRGSKSLDGDRLAKREAPGISRDCDLANRQPKNRRALGLPRGPSSSLTLGITCDLPWDPRQRAPLGLIYLLKGFSVCPSVAGFQQEISPCLFASAGRAPDFRFSRAPPPKAPFPSAPVQDRFPWR